MNEHLLSFWDHLDDLRRTILFVFGCILLGTIGSFYFSQEVIALLTQPLTQLEKPSSPLHHLEMHRERILNAGSIQQTYIASENTTVVFLAKGAQEISAKHYDLPPGSFIEIEQTIDHPPLILLGPLDGMITAFKLSLWIGIVGTSPFWIFALLRFMAPGLEVAEKKLLGIFLGLSFISMGMGLFFGWNVTIPVANQYLQAFNGSIGTNLWTLASYLDYTFVLLVANAFAFELGLGLLFLVHIGVLSKDSLVAKRRHAILAAFILGALLTPPDIMTQILVALPLITLYESAILYARFQHQRP